MEQPQAPRAWLEPAMAALVAVVAVIGHAQANSPGGALVLDVAAAASAGLVAWRPRASLVATTLALCGFLTAPVAWSTIGELAALIPVLRLAARGRRRESFGGAAVFGALVVAGSLREPEASGMPLLYVAFWGAAFLLALVLGNAFHAFGVATQRAHAARLTEQRTELARDLHDTVAHRLATMSLRAQRAQVHGMGDAEDLAFFVRTSAECLDELRTVVWLLRAGSERSEAAWHPPAAAGGDRGPGRPADRGRSCGRRAPRRGAHDPVG